MAVVDASSPPDITRNQLARVAIGDTKHDTARALGGRGDKSSVATGPAEESGGGAVRRYDDCWSYRLADDRDDASVATVCFDTVGEVVLIDTTCINPFALPGARWAGALGHGCRAGASGAWPLSTRSSFQARFAP